MEKEKNPYAKDGGEPKDGFMAEFWEWEVNSREDMVSKLYKEEQEKIKKSAECLRRRMKS